MANDSTTFLNTDVKSKAVKKPRISTILFLRQFARAYFSCGESELTSYVLN